MLVAHNETFGPITACSFARYELRIYNRWGRLVFQSDDPAVAWDGRDALEGVYVWQLSFGGALGDQASGSLAGSVLVFR